MKILVVVMSCHNHWSMWEGIKQNIHDDLIIFSSSPKNENWYDKEKRVLYLNCRDSYECLPEKIICMIDQVLTMDVFNKYTHILKIDDHEAINLTEEKISNLYNYEQIKNGHYIGQDLLMGAGPSSGLYHFGKVDPNSYWHNLEYKGTYSPWLNGGKTYILSRNAMKCINKEYNFTNLDILYKNEIYEDLMIGKILYKYNIHPKLLKYNI